MVERGTLGVWLVGGKGAVLVRGRGRRVQCYCVRATGKDLPLADRVAHLLLALRADERGFATVANLSFSGARWRLARKLGPSARIGLQSSRLGPVGGSLTRPAGAVVGGALAFVAAGLGRWG